MIWNGKKSFSFAKVTQETLLSRITKSTIIWFKSKPKINDLTPSTTVIMISSLYFVVQHYTTEYNVIITTVFTKTDILKGSSEWWKVRQRDIVVILELLLPLKRRMSFSIYFEKVIRSLSSILSGHPSVTCCWVELIDSHISHLSKYWKSLNWKSF